MKPILHELPKLFRVGNKIAAYNLAYDTPMIDYSCVIITCIKDCPEHRDASCRQGCRGLGKHMQGQFLSAVTGEVISTYGRLCTGYEGADFEWREYEES